MKDTFKCTGCGAEMPFEELDFELREDASLTCPICKSKFTISALLTEPGAAPAEEAPAGEELAPETPAEETPAGEEAAPAGGAPEATPGPAAEVAASAPEQITAKESVEDRVAKAMEDVKSGKSLQDILGSLLSKPIKISSPRRLGMVGLREGLEDVDQIVSAGNDPEGNPVTILYDAKYQEATVRFGKSYTWPNTSVLKVSDFVKGLYDALVDLVHGKEVPESLDERKYIDLTPTPAEYRHLLHLVVKNSSDSASRKWAKNELGRVQNVDSWKKKEPEEARPMAAGESRVITMGGSHDRSSGGHLSGLLGYKFPVGKATGESVVEKARAFLAEKKDDECWTGDFATFSAKLFGACKDLDIVVDDYENVIRSLQEKEAIELNKDEVTICLKKAKDVFVDFLKGQVKTAEQQSAAVGDLTEPPKVAPDLGSAPAGAPAAEGKKLAEEDNDSSKGVEEKVDQVLKKFFA
jgi:DNA-directed RNA polymerase subunit RPC12/RpoP